MEHAVSVGKDLSASESVGHVSVLRPFRWLKLAWADIMENPLPSISQGLILAAMGWMVIVLSSSQIELLALAISGFLLVGPVFGAGFYALSRLRARGEAANFDNALDEALKNIGSLARLGVILAIIALVWGLVSSLLFQQAFSSQMPEIQVSFYRTVFDWPHAGFLVTYVATGAVLAVLAFTISAISAPMIFDRGGSTAHAIMTSVKVVAKNPLPMALWAALIAALTLLGFATLMAGLVITLPLIGHATWHAYRDVLPE
jgi:uncharacterized membrane protein